MEPTALPVRVIFYPSLCSSNSIEVADYHEPGRLRTHSWIQGLFDRRMNVWVRSPRAVPNIACIVIQRQHRDSLTAQ